MLARAGLMTPGDFLGSMSSAIAALQKSPGRLVQSLEQGWNLEARPRATAAQRKRLGALLSSSSRAR